VVRTEDGGRQFKDAYWNDLWAYYEHGGRQDVAAYLLQRDISGFNAKAPPRKTPAFWAIVDANRSPEESELADLLETLGNPHAILLSRICSTAEGEFADWLKERKNRRVIGHRLDKCGYAAVRNPDASDGLWKILGKRQVVYAQKSLPLRDQIIAARQLP
jgi:hypothetical protein